VIPTFVRNDYFTGDILNKNLIHSGSREHYFHFFLGYVLPIIKEQNLLKLKKFNVLDCGPLLTGQLKEILQTLNYRFKIIEKDKISNPIYVDKWDHLEITDFNLFHKTINLIDNLFKSKKILCCDGITSKNLVLKRSAPHPYYLKNSTAEISGYGETRRSITNLNYICSILDQSNIKYKLYDPGLHSLSC
jgi:hypothetical protein